MSETTDPVERGMSKRPWQRLSETLRGPRQPDMCQSCGRGYDLERYQEHADNDEPEPIVVILCEECALRLIDRHPRLYRDLEPGEVFPGTEGFCRDCLHREGLACSHPHLRANGGPGLPIKGSGKIGSYYMCGKKGYGAAGDVLSLHPKECTGRMVGEGSPPRVIAYIGGINDGHKAKELPR